MNGRQQQRTQSTIHIGRRHADMWPGSSTGNELRIHRSTRLPKRAKFMTARKPMPAIGLQLPVKEGILPQFAFHL